MALRIPLIIAVLHLSACVAAFISVGSSGEAQAGFVWFIFLTLDFPTSSIVYDIADYFDIDWYQFGNGPNVRALVLLGIFGSIHWFIISWFCCWFGSLAKNRLSQGGS